MLSPDVSRFTPAVSGRGQRACRHPDILARSYNAARTCPFPTGEEPMSSIAVHPIAGPLAAGISGVDLAADLDKATLADIRRAWLEHLVIFFRDQDIPPATFLAFARRFGTPVEYPFVKGLDETPEVI